MSDDKNKIQDNASQAPLLPKITNDEIDLEVDEKRNDEIKADRPPHHGG